jgi:precorrin-6B methylase 2
MCGVTTNHVFNNYMKLLKKQQRLIKRAVIQHNFCLCYRAVRLFDGKKNWIVSKIAREQAAAKGKATIKLFYYIIVVMHEFRIRLLYESMNTTRITR